MLQCGQLNSGHLPIVVGILSALTLGGTYVMAVYRDDVDPVLPYISATGNSIPESCIFSQLLNITAALTLLVMYFRYRLVGELNRGANTHLDWCNWIALCLAFASCTGLSVVANFQEDAVHSVHMTGALLCFGCGALYTVLHTYITHRMYPLYVGRRICVIRAGISLICCVAFVVATGCGITAVVIRDRSGLPSTFAMKDLHNRHRWHWGDNGFLWHLASTIGEWTAAISMVMFTMTYSREMEHLKINVHTDVLVSHLDDEPVGRPQYYDRHNSMAIPPNANLIESSGDF